MEHLVGTGIKHQYDGKKSTQMHYNEKVQSERIQNI